MQIRDALLTISKYNRQERSGAEQRHVALCADLYSRWGLDPGIGRTGKWFGFEHYDLSPDIIACGKGIGNGYPVSCIAINNEIAEKLLESGFCYAQSHQNDPLGCAVVCAVLTEIRDSKLIENSANMGKYFVDKLHDLFGNKRCISEIRGRGLMIAIELEQHVPIDNIHRSLFEKGWLVGLNRLIKHCEYTHH